MRANQRRLCSGLFGKLIGQRSSGYENGSQKQNLDAARGVPRRLRQAACALLLLGLAVSVTVGGRAAQQDVPAAPAATPNSTSLNGPGNIFLTASLVRTGGANFFGASPSVVAADFNWDAQQCLAVADAGANAVSILVGNGDGR